MLKFSGWGKIFFGTVDFASTKEANGDLSQSDGLLGSSKSNSSELVVRDITATVYISAMIYILTTVFECQYRLGDKKMTNSKIF
jgi:hypothetical protein